MALYCAYVAAFGVATIADESWISIIAACGAILGGTGAGFLWTAQGAYFAAAASEYQCAFRNENGEDDSDEEVETTREQSEEPSSQQLAGIFASIYLVFEVVLRALSTFLQRFTQVSWSATFGIYATIAIISTLGMTLVENPRRTTPAAEESQVSIWHKSTSALQVLVNDPKMKYMVGLNAVFGWVSAFLTSYVNGQVVFRVFGSDAYVGILSAWVSCVAAASSLGMGKLPESYRGTLLRGGALCFATVGITFMVFRSGVGWLVLIAVYTLHGMGRATFESTLRSTFADFFTDKEGAFANIILQNGLTSAIGFVLTIQLQCSSPSPYCVEYRDGTHHDILVFELLIVVTAILAILGYNRAVSLHLGEQSYNLIAEPGLDTGDTVVYASLGNPVDDESASPNSEIRGEARKQE